jgi:hypothetical protein
MIRRRHVGIDGIALFFLGTISCPSAIATSGHGLSSLGGNMPRRGLTAMKQPMGLGEISAQLVNFRQI